MFRATRALLAPGVVKKTTGLVGVPVVSNAREVLVSLYEKTLEDVKIMPETVFYRTSVEAITNYRLKVVKENDDIEKIEEIIGQGQVEELIDIAKDELELIPAYASWKTWEEPFAVEDNEAFEDGITAPALSQA